MKNEQTNQGWTLWLRGMVIVVIVAVFAISSGPGQASQGELPRGEKIDEEMFEREWGISILSLRLSAAGYMLDFRYRVVDAEKARPLFLREVKPYLVDQSSGARFLVPNPPKTGPLRNSNPPLEGRNYFMFFANPGRYIEAGSKVTVVIGDFQARDLIVE